MAAQTTTDHGGRDVPSSSGEPLVYAAAGLSLAATLVHLWAMPEQMIMWWGYGTLLLAAALLQGVFGVAMLRWPDQRLAFAGVWIPLAVLAQRVVVHTSGLPFGPHTGKVEDLGPLDVATIALELGLVFVLVTLLEGARRRVAMNALLILGGAIWALRFLGIL